MAKKKKPVPHKAGKRRRTATRRGTDHGEPRRTTPKIRVFSATEIAAAEAEAAEAAGAADAIDAQILSSDLTLHELFAQQTSAMLDRADLSDEQKQSLLIGMSCPCCGAGGFSFTAKLRR